MLLMNSNASFFVTIDVVRLSRNLAFSRFYEVYRIASGYTPTSHHSIKEVENRLMSFPALHKHCLAILAAMITFSSTFDACSAETSQSVWYQWRGPDQNRTATGDPYPRKWGESKDGEKQNIDWKLKLPGGGASTPVIASDTAFLTFAADGKNHLASVGLADGTFRWQVELGDDRGGKHRKGGGSNPSAITDGQQVFAYFRSGDLACVDVKGNVQWQVNLQDRFGEDTLWWDLGTSPILTDDAVVVAVMQTGPSYLVAFNKVSGELLWKVDRITDAPEEAAQSYATPLNVVIDNQPAIAVFGADCLTLHRAGDGTEFARLGGFNPDGEKFFRSIASPTAKDHLIVCPYSRGERLTTVDMNHLADGKGDAAIVWKSDQLGSDVPTPALDQQRVYLVSDGKTSRGLTTCLDLQTGETIWQWQLPKSRHSFSSSPLVADNHLYVTSENGTTFVIGPLDQEQPELVATNEIDDDEPFTVASLVPIDESLLLRSKTHLYRISE